VEVEVARSENHLGFRGDGVQIFTRLIEGPYPNYEQVIPKDNDKTLIVEKAALTARSGGWPSWRPIRHTGSGCRWGGR
jgi:DNA polymerase III sliding clamp (beta) subunit (PCNA family)